MRQRITRRRPMDHQPMPQADVVLELPGPIPSVNRTRRVNWAGHRKLLQWHTDCNWQIAAFGPRDVSRGIMKPIDRFELHVTVGEQGCDLDNLKAIADYLKRIEVIADDARKNMRRLVVEVGDVPAGRVRVTVRPIS